VPRRETFTAKKLEEVHAEAEAELGMVTAARIADLPALPVQVGGGSGLGWGGRLGRGGRCRRVGATGANGWVGSPRARARFGWLGARGLRPRARLLLLSFAVG
jgi:hypothetical protein